MVKCSESESSYMGGCRCSGCRKAHTDKERGRRAKRRKNPSGAETKSDRSGTSRLPMIHDTLTLEELRRARGWDD